MFEAFWKAPRWSTVEPKIISKNRIFDQFNWFGWIWNETHFLFFFAERSNDFGKKTKQKRKKPTDWNDLIGRLSDEVHSTIDSSAPNCVCGGMISSFRLRCVNDINTFLLRKILFSNYWFIVDAGPMPMNERENVYFMALFDWCVACAVHHLSRGWTCCYLHEVWNRVRGPCWAVGPCFDCPQLNRSMGAHSHAEAFEIRKLHRFTNEKYRIRKREVDAQTSLEPRKDVKKI